MLHPTMMARPDPLDTMNMADPQIQELGSADLFEASKYWPSITENINMRNQVTQRPSLQQMPMIRFMDEPTRPLFYTPKLLPSSNQFGGMGMSTPVASMPRTAHHFGAESPTLEPTSATVSASSPATEPFTPNDNYIVGDRYHEQVGWPRYQPDSLPCVNLSQIEGFANYDQRLGSNNTYSNVNYDDSLNAMRGHVSGASGIDPAFNWDSTCINGGIGDTDMYEQLVGGAASTYHLDPRHLSDADVPGESEDDFEQAEEREASLPASDDEYQPLSKSMNKRKSSKQLSPGMTKRSRPTTATKYRPKSHHIPQSTNTTPIRCTSCRLTFPTPTLYTRHHITQHSRPYTCIFAFAGCSAVFPTKNEWKRHTSTQHLHLSSWYCPEGACANGAGYEFNRKDLFKNHLERMHRPAILSSGSNAIPKGANKTKGLKKARRSEVSKRDPARMMGSENSAGAVERAQEEWDSKVLRLQTDCEVINRKTPPFMLCPAVGCETVFRGENAWDERMEHVGRHLKAWKEGKERECVLDFEKDAWMMGWCEGEGVLVRGEQGGGWRCGIGTEGDNRVKVGRGGRVRGGEVGGEREDGEGEREVEVEEDAVGEVYDG